MGLLKTAAKVAVASSVHGRVQRRQQERWAAQDAGANPVPAPRLAADTPAPATNTSELLTQLTQLGELRAAGVLTDAEFEEQKARILALQS